MTSDQPADEEPAPSRPRRRYIAASGVLAAVTALALLLGWGLRHDPSAIHSALVGKKAPDFALRTVDGTHSLRLSRLKGDVIVLNFWASWCAACREEHPNFLQAWSRFRDQGVVFVGVIYQDSPGAARAYMRELGGGWPNLVDPGDQTAIDYGVYGVPETFFIGPDGMVAYKQIGYSSYPFLVAEVERLLPAIASSSRKERDAGFQAAAQDIFQRPQQGRGGASAPNAN